MEHTWWKKNWPVCTTKWLYVWGSRAGEVCVSTTAPFKYHNDGIEPLLPFQLLFLEPWTEYIPGEIVFEPYFIEYWGTLPLHYGQYFLEPWTS
ncbi:hypothetical protein ES705_48980 [subsurface metagenome]